MLKGSFDPTSGRPYIEGLLVIPALGVDEVVSFLVDTGSDVTCLMPADGVRFGIDYLAPGQDATRLGQDFVSHRPGGLCLALRGAVARTF